MKIKLSIYKTKRFSDDIDQVLNLERVKSEVVNKNWPPS